LESAGTDLDDIAQGMVVGEAICAMREAVATAERPQDEGARTSFGVQTEIAESQG
jgi:hypothetical protein